MNIITEKLPCSLNVGGTDYPVKTDFRAVFAYIAILNEDISDEEMLYKSLCFMFSDNIPEDIESAVKFLNDFVSGPEPAKKGRPSNKVLGMNNEIPMDYEQDSGKIWSAFFRTYNIDLCTVDYMHWWMFLLLLWDLPSDTRLGRTMEIRTRDLSDMPKDTKKKYQAMQRYMRIEEKKSEEDEKLIEALRNGIDPNTLGD